MEALGKLSCDSYFFLISSCAQQEWSKNTSRQHLKLMTKRITERYDLTMSQDRTDRNFKVFF